MRLITKKNIITIFCVSLIFAVSSFTGCLSITADVSSDKTAAAGNSETGADEPESTLGAQPESTGNTGASADSENTETSISMRIASLKGPTSIGMLMLHKKNPSLGNNVSSIYEIVSNPEVMISKILSNEVQVAALPTNVAVKLYNKGSGYRIAAITGYGVLYLLQQDSSIRSWTDLKGQKINVVSKGSTPDIVLRFLLEKNGLKPETDVTLDYALEQVELSQLMIADKADISILPEPFVTLIIKKNPKVKIAFDIEAEWKKVQSGEPMPMSCVVVNAGFADKHREIVDEFLRQYELSTLWVNNNIEDASLLVEEFKIGMDAATAKEAIPRCNILFTSLDKSKEIIKNYISTLLEFSPEDVGGKMPDENLYY